MNIIEQMLKKYDPQSETELINALKEIFQEITLLGLYRGGFFDKAAFMVGRVCEYFMDWRDFQRIWTFHS